MSTPIEQILATVQSYYDFVLARLQHSFGGFFSLSQWEWIRLALVIVGYIAVRPLIVKFGSYVGEKEMAKRERKENERIDRERRERKRQAKVGANDLRGGGSGAGKVLGEVGSDDDEEVVVEGVNVSTASGRDGGVGKGVKTGAGRRKGDEYKGLNEATRKILEDMESDDDVEDLITGREDM
jgi:hypothetical protein